MQHIFLMMDLGPGNTTVDRLPGPLALNDWS